MSAGVPEQEPVGWLCLWRHPGGVWNYDGFYRTEEEARHLPRNSQYEHHICPIAPPPKQEPVGEDAHLALRGWLYELRAKSRENRKKYPVGTKSAAYYDGRVDALTAAIFNDPGLKLRRTAPPPEQPAASEGEERRDPTAPVTERDEIREAMLRAYDGPSWEERPALDDSIAVAIRVLQETGRAPSAAEGEAHRVLREQVEIHGSLEQFLRAALTKSAP